MFGAAVAASAVAVAAAGADPASLALADEPPAFSPCMGQNISFQAKSQSHPIKKHTFACTSSSNLLLLFVC